MQGRVWLHTTVVVVPVSATPAEVDGLEENRVHACNVPVLQPSEYIAFELVQEISSQFVEWKMGEFMAAG